jgi:DNA-binding response OmpR family regulator
LQEEFSAPFNPRLAFILLYMPMAMKVLIIEKDKTVRQSLFYFMERYKNCEVFLAGSKKEGTSLFETTPFDIVLCGDRLPDGSGLEMLREWVNQNPKLISILMTVQGDERLRQEALKAGIQGYLVKPFDLKQLEEAMGILDFGMRIGESNKERR